MTHFSRARTLRQRNIRRRTLRLENLERRSLLATVTWDGGGNPFDWSDDRNWTNDTPPVDGDDVVISAAPNAVITGIPNRILRSLNTNTGIEVTGHLTLMGDWHLVSSVVQGPFNNSGTVTLGTDAFLQMNGGGVSTGAFNAPQAFFQFGGTHSLGQTSSVSASWAIFGAGSGTSVIAGEYSVSDVTTIAQNVDFSGHVTSVGNRLTLDGPSGMTANFHNTPLTVHTLQLGSWPVGNTLITGDMTVTNRFDWTNGKIAGTGTTTIAASANLYLDNPINAASGVYWTVDGRTVQNLGTTTLRSLNSAAVANTELRILELRNGAQFNNLGAFVALDHINADRSAIVGNGGAAFTNTGTFTTGSAEVFGISVPFNNAGQVTLNAGSLYFTGGGTSSGSFVTAAANTNLLFSGHGLNPQSSIAGPGIVSLNGNNLVQGSYNVSGATDLFAGTTNFTGVVSNVGNSLTIFQATADFQNTYLQTHGSTILNAGVLSAPTIDIQAGTLSGKGTLSGNVINRANIAPADGQSLHVTGNYTQQSSGSLTVNVNDSVTQPPLIVDGSVSLQGALVVVAGTATGLQDRLMIQKTSSGSIVGQFSGAGTVTAQDGSIWDVAYDGGNGNDVSIRKLANAPPVVPSLNVTTTEDAAVSFVLSAADDHTPVSQLVFTITTLPAQGVLRGPNGAVIQAGTTFVGAPQLTYEPSAVCDAAPTDGFTFTVRDGDNATSSASVTITILPAVVDGGVTIDGQGVVRIGGTSGNDNIVLTASNGILQLNGANTGISISNITEIRVWGRGGDDVVDLSSLALRSLVYGGAGNDVLRGGSITDLMFGGAGNDQITGGAGDDFLSGGAGIDRIVGSAGSDVLVAGSLDCRTSRSELDAFLAMWADHQVSSEEDNSADGLFEDLAYDQLTGSSGADWFILSEGDKITDFKVRNDDGDVVTWAS